MKGLEMTNVKQSKRENFRPNFCTTNERKTNIKHINKRQSLNYRLLTMNSHIHTEYVHTKFKKYSTVD